MKDARKAYDTNTNTNYKADSGAVVVMEAKTGRVVAMASNPTYDPNAWVGGISAKDYASAHRQELQLPAAQPGHPGSVRARLDLQGDLHLRPPSTPATTSTATTPAPARTRSAARSSRTSRARASAPSPSAGRWRSPATPSSTASRTSSGRRTAASSPKKHPKDWFYKTAHQFGLGKETGIDLPNEVTGRVPDRQWKKDYWKANKDGWCKTGQEGRQTTSSKIAHENCLDGNKMRAGDSINYAIGQGDTLVTPIQMATIYAAIANGGTLYHPTVGKAVVSADGKNVQRDQAHGSHGKLPVQPRRP